MHDHSKDKSLKNIRLAFFLNLGFATFELIGGIWTNSLAIMSDALHDFGDSTSLGISFFLEKISKKKRTKEFSYGYKRFSLLAAFINGTILLIGSLFILSQAIPRLLNPEHVNAKGMLVFALVGILVNGSAALRLKKGTSMNEKMVSLHLFEDVFGWIAVLIVSIFALFNDIHILDPILSILISLYTLYKVTKSLKKTAYIFLQGVPKDIKIDEIEHTIKNFSEILEVHDTHVWSLDGENNILTTHFKLKKGISEKNKTVIKQQAKLLFQKHDIHHSTIELEEEGGVCLTKDNTCLPE